MAGWRMGRATVGVRSHARTMPRARPIRIRATAESALAETTDCRLHLKVIFRPRETFTRSFKRGRAAAASPLAQLDLGAFAQRLPPLRHGDGLDHPREVTPSARPSPTPGARGGRPARTGRRAALGSRPGRPRPCSRRRRSSRPSPRTLSAPSARRRGGAPLTECATSCRHRSSRDYAWTTRVVEDPKLVRELMVERGALERLKLSEPIPVLVDHDQDRQVGTVREVFARLQLALLDPPVARPRRRRSPVLIPAKVAP